MLTPWTRLAGAQRGEELGAALFPQRQAYAEGS
jgi:hypothetical protein